MPGPVHHITTIFFTICHGSFVWRDKSIPMGRGLPGSQRHLMLQIRVLQPLVEVEHLRDERNHAIVAGLSTGSVKLMVRNG